MSSHALTLRAPLKGVVVPLEEVPDPVFAGATLGPGIAIDPLGETLHAPCNGEVIHCARTRHALTLRDDQGGEWLLHIGLDTVDLDGEGFELLVAEGERVSAGDPLCRFEAERLASGATALITPLVLTNADALGAGVSIEHSVSAGQVVEMGETLLTWSSDGAAAERAVPRSSTAAGDEAQDASGAATLASANGLHARPAARLRAIAREHDVDLTLRAADGREANVASVSALLHLGLGHGDRVEIRASGTRASAAVKAVAEALAQPEPTHDVASGSREALSDVAGQQPSAMAADELSGVSASPGVAVGPLVAFSMPLPAVAHDGEDPVMERAALEQALARVATTLASQARDARQRGQLEEAEIFEAHAAWLDDPDLRKTSESHIDAGRSAGQAWFEALEAEAVRLRESESALLAARAEDLRDLQRQVMQHLASETHGQRDGSRSSEPAQDDGRMQDSSLAGAILIARDLTLSQFVAVAESIAGLCLAAGGATSHVAILARARNVPCLVAMGEALFEAHAQQDGGKVCLDAQRGRLELRPEPSRLADIASLQSRQRDEARQAAAMASEKAVTRDGRHIHVMANVGSAPEAEQAVAAGADGIGLMRSEFLFLSSSEAPSGEAQRASYAAAAAVFEGRAVIVRTLDIGADKQLPYLTLPDAPNPALGERGVRLWRRFPDLFDTQLDALLMAAAGGPVDAEGRPALRVMLPMVSDLSELRWARERMAERAAALALERLPPLGVMIEVPTAALCADTLAREADFLSIGTNDLTQYALAMDREVGSLAASNDVLHPGVLKLISVCLSGAKGHCPVGVCGAAAGDPLAGALLVAMGVDELSVEPARVAATKATLRRLDVRALAAQVPQLLAMESATQIREALAAWLEATPPVDASSAAATSAAKPFDSTTTRS